MLFSPEPSSIYVCGVSARSSHLEGFLTLKYIRLGRDTGASSNYRRGRIIELQINNVRLFEYLAKGVVKPGANFMRGQRQEFAL